MKDEDADWLIYHLAACSPSPTTDGLISESGLDPSAVEKSLERLERNLLIERKTEKVRVLSAGEMLLLCQIKSSQNLLYTIENDIIREKKE